MSEVSVNVIGLKEGIWELTDLSLNPSLTTYLPAGEPLASCFTSVNFSFLFFKMGKILAPSHRITKGLNQIICGMFSVSSQFSVYSTLELLLLLFMIKQRQEEEISQGQQENSSLRGQGLRHVQGAAFVHSFTQQIFRICIDRTQRRGAGRLEEAGVIQTCLVYLCDGG